ncbi:MAG: nucleotidyltransferase domain-containing protein [Deltaproteobacteria bacterium]|nr:nucleotidyltransferase domain-containing protein [Deltaproteobacteria bacterium]
MEDLGPYITAWRARWAREAVETAARAGRMRALAGVLAAALRTEFGARRVWLIGSLARGKFGPRSDLDLVAEGIAPGDLFRACARAQQLAGDVEVDLAPGEDLRPAARRALEREGVEL